VRGEGRQNGDRSLSPRDAELYNAATADGGLLLRGRMSRSAALPPASCLPRPTACGMCWARISCAS